MPSYLFRMSCSASTDCARLVSKKWLRYRKLPAFASPSAYARSGVHGKTGRPRIEVRIGPCRADQSVRDCLPWSLTSTVTVREVICSGLPSYRYVVGEPGTSFSSYGVNRYAVET